MPAQKVRTVLLVDDDVAVLAVLRHTLEQDGWRVLSASNGLEALTQHEPQRESLDLLISDLDMPQMSGQALAKHLRAQRPDLPIVFISGDPGVEPLPTETDFPNHFFLQKPFLPSELLAQLKTLFVS